MFTIRSSYQMKVIEVYQDEQEVYYGGAIYTLKASCYKKPPKVAQWCNITEENVRIRRLTAKECWRLMGFENSDYERAKGGLNNNLYNGKDRSSSQLYKQAGNSIVVDVLVHIMENLYDAMPYLFDDMQVASFFSGIGAFEKALSRLNSNSDI